MVNDTLSLSELPFLEAIISDFCGEINGLANEILVIKSLLENEHEKEYYQVKWKNNLILKIYLQIFQTKF